VSANPGNAQATVSFTPPSATGGAPITGYTVTASPGGATATGGNSPITVTGLSNGTAYTFTVRATNAAGTGAASIASTAVTPFAPSTISFTATPGVTTATVQWSTTRTDITAWTVGRNGTDSDGTGPYSTTVASTVAFVVFDKLIAGTLYTFTLTPQTAVGSLPSLTATATPTSSATAPGSPTTVTAVGGNAQATVSFIAPASDGGAAITGYTVTASPGGATATGASSPLTVTGLTNGTPYTFTVKATNSAGTGPASAASNPVTPAATASISFTVTPGAGQVSATWSTTRTDITAWTVGRNGTDSTGAGPWSTTLASNVTSIVFDKLVASTSYTFTLTPQTASGNLASLTQTATPSAASVPGVPTGVSAAAGNAQATVSFTPPSATGGAPITGYTATSSPGTITGTSSSSPIIVNGLTNGTAYTFTVKATNSAGTGSASSASNSVTPAAGSSSTANTLVGWSTIGPNDITGVTQEQFGNFMARQDWEDLYNCNYLAFVNPTIPAYKSAHAAGTVNYGVPLIPHESPAGPNAEMDSALSGAHDNDYRTMGANLVQYTPSNGTCYARLWWEFNMAAPDATRFVNTWRRAVPLIRQGFNGAKSSGQSIKICWCYLSRNGNPVPYWPGGAYVDVVSSDIYGMKYGTTNPSVSAMVADVQAALNELTNYGQTYGKPVAIDEWANCTAKGGSQADSRGCGDCPEYINQIFDWAVSVNAEYLCYFGDAGGAGVGTTLTATPNSLAAFKTRAIALQS
jgi:beta-mannanase